MSAISPNLSPRRFLVAGRTSEAAGYMAPNLFGQAESLVEHAISESASAKIAVQTVRQNVSVLLGPAGNIAVLTGPDGKLFIDSAIVNSGSQASMALANIARIGSRVADRRTTV